MGSRDSDVSIITVCLNSAATIARTVDSVLSQKNSGDQYIVIDGGSNDGTQEIVRGYGKDIDHFISEPDEGIADAFNKGIEHAEGGIVGIINADDVLLPTVLDQIKNYFQRNPTVDVVHGDVLLYERDRFVKRIAPPRRWWYPWRLIVFNHPATFVRRAVYDQCGVYDKSLEVAMDLEIYLRWMKCGRLIHYVPIPLVRMNAGGVSGQQVVKGFFEKRRALLKYGYPRLLVESVLIGNLSVQGILSIRRFMRSRWTLLRRDSSGIRL